MMRHMKLKRCISFSLLTVGVFLGGVLAVAPRIQATAPNFIVTVYNEGVPVSGVWVCRYHSGVPSHFSNPFNVHWWCGFTTTVTFPTSHGDDWYGSYMFHGEGPRAGFAHNHDEHLMNFMYEKYGNVIEGTDLDCPDDFWEQEEHIYPPNKAWDDGRPTYVTQYCHYKEEDSAWTVREGNWGCRPWSNIIIVLDPRYDCGRPSLDSYCTTCELPDADIPDGVCYLGENPRDCGVFTNNAETRIVSFDCTPRCTNLYQSCTSDSDCCSNLCEDGICTETPVSSPTSIPTIAPSPSNTPIPSSVPTPLPTLTPTVAPTSPISDCDSGKECESCGAIESNTCAIGNGVRTCQYRAHSVESTCRVVSFEEACTVDACDPGFNCINDQCQQVNCNTKLDCGGSLCEATETNTCHKNNGTMQCFYTEYESPSGDVYNNCIPQEVNQVCTIDSCDLSSSCVQDCLNPPCPDATCSVDCQFSLDQTGGVCTNELVLGIDSGDDVDEGRITIDAFEGNEVVGCQTDWLGNPISYNLGDCPDTNTSGTVEWTASVRDSDGVCAQNSKTGVFELDIDDPVCPGGTISYAPAGKSSCPEQYALTYQVNTTTDEGCGATSLNYNTQIVRSDGETILPFADTYVSSPPNGVLDEGAFGGATYKFERSVQDGAGNVTTCTNDISIPLPSPYPTVHVQGTYYEDYGREEVKTCAGSMTVDPNALTIDIDVTGDDTNDLTVANKSIDATGYSFDLIFDNRRQDCVDPSQTFAIDARLSGYKSVQWRTSNQCGGTDYDEIVFTLPNDIPPAGDSIDLSLFFKLGQPWYKLSDTSFINMGTGRGNYIPSNVEPFDASDDDTSDPYMVVGNAGLIVSEQDISLGYVHDRYSQPNWINESYAVEPDNIRQQAQLFRDYAIARKKYQSVAGPADMTEDGFVYVLDAGGGVVNFASMPNITQSVILIQGDAVLGNGSSATFGNANKSIAIIVTNNLSIHPDVTTLYGIFVANSVDLAHGLPSGDYSREGLKIVGNIVVSDPIDLTRRWRDDNRKPSFLVKFDSKMYFDVLPLLVLREYEWRQLQ